MCGEVGARLLNFFRFKRVLGMKQGVGFVYVVGSTVVLNVGRAEST